MGKQRLFFPFGKDTDFSSCMTIRYYYGQGFVLSFFSLPQFQYSLFTGGIHGQMKTAKPPDGYYFSLLQGMGRHSYRIITFNFSALPVMPGQMRTTHRATIGLGMKSPVSCIMILLLAAWTHGENLHRGFRPVIGDGLND